MDIGNGSALRAIKRKHVHILDPEWAEAVNQKPNMHKLRLIIQRQTNSINKAVINSKRKMTTEKDRNCSNA